MRNADIQTDITKDKSKGMVIKTWRPVFDDHNTEAVSARIWILQEVVPKSERIKATIKEIKDLFCNTFKR